MMLNSVARGRPVGIAGSRAECVGRGRFYFEPPPVFLSVTMCRHEINPLTFKDNVLTRFCLCRSPLFVVDGDNRRDLAFPDLVNGERDDLPHRGHFYFPHGSAKYDRDSIVLQELERAINGHCAWAADALPMQKRTQTSVNRIKPSGNAVH